MKSFCQLTATVCLLVGLVASARATFSSIYIFGDSISATTTNNNAIGSATNFYYGKRYSNGRTWVEVLAQRQGLGADSISNVNWGYSSNNLSYYGQYSSLLITNVNRFQAPATATNCLFVVWVDNADFVGDMNSPGVGSPAGAPNNGTNLSAWTVAINQHLANHYNIITNLYAKGCRVLVAPNVTDVTAVPEFNQSPAAWRAFVRQRIISFNTNYVAMLNQIAASSPGLRIYVPDVFQLLNNVLTNAAYYGLTNVLLAGQPIDAVEFVPGVAIDGTGNDYIFWDFLGNPTAKMHEVLADTVQQMISPVQFSRIIPSNGSNRLDMVNLPIGMSGWVCCATNLSLPVWQTNRFVLSGDSATQSIFVPCNGAQLFYKLEFPWQWSWP